jgi:8-oxo-dGTP pyrophosphatase MutT (NUDIX family)
VAPTGRLVLVRQHANSWSLPKGGVESGENVLDAAKREIWEETGIAVADLVYVQDLGQYARKSIAPGGHGETNEYGVRTRVLFLFTTPQEITPARPDPTGEITDMRWVTFAEALVLLTHPKDAEFLVSVHAELAKAGVQ